MLNIKTNIKAAIVGCAVAAASQAGANETPIHTLEAGVSTLGAYIAPVFNLKHRNTEIRAPFYFMNSKTVFNDDNGNDITGRLGVKSGGLVADYYIGATGIRLSGGVAAGGYVADADVKNPMIDGHTYKGLVNVKIEQTKKIAPVLSVGYRYMFRNNWGFSTELGARVSSLKVGVTGMENLPAAERDRFEADIREINDDLGKVKAVPFANIGLSFQF